MSDPAAPAPRPARRKLSPARKALFVLVLAVGPLLALEVALRLAGWPTDRIRSISKLVNTDRESYARAIGQFRPGERRRILFPPELQYTVSINALGLRGPEIELAPPADRPRILALGDSYTFGYYCEDPDTIPAQLQRWLEGQGLAAEVVNAGFGGWGPKSEVLFFEERGVKLLPDVVLLTFCSVNDIHEMARETPPYLNWRDLPDPKNRVITALYSSALAELVLRFKVWSKRARQRAEGEDPHPVASTDVPADQVEPLWTAYGEWLTRLRDAARARGARLVVAYGPDAYKLIEGKPADDEARLRALCQRLEVGYVDPLPAFQAAPEVRRLFHIPYDWHLNAAGNTLVAEAVGRYLLEQAEPLGLRPLRRGAPR